LSFPLFTLKRRFVPIFLIKTILSIVLLLLAFIAMFTMFEIFGRSEKRFNPSKLIRIHKFNGRFYFLLFLVISYFCIDFMVKTKGEIAPRATFHAVFALTIIVLLFLKISFVRIYRQFYNQVKILGLLIALLTFLLVGTSGGYYLIVTQFGTNVPIQKDIQEKKEVQKEAKVIVRTDTESIRKGNELYESKCSFCHDPYSTKIIVGPGHKGILKNPYFPVTKLPATPGNVEKQLRSPYKDMPSFSYLSDSDVQNIIAFLNTL